MSDVLDPEQIAIVGMAGRFPGAADVSAFWDNLCHGVESIRAFSDAELDAAGVDTRRRSDPDFVNAGAVMDDADGFDAAFFGMSAREAELTDPQHRVFLECAWAAIEDAGYDVRRFEGRIGVFGGVAANTYFQRNVLSDPERLERTGDYPLLIASEREYAITRVAYKLGLSGPALSVNTACSTSAVAVHLAAQSLMSGESDLALAGGARVRVPLTGGYLYQEDGILSPDGHCRAFDADARGTVAASGVAIVALKRLSDAVRDGDTVYAVIRGTAVNNDGDAKIGYTAPGVAGQTAVIEEALAIAEVDADSIGMVEAHGTGTSLGDPIEIAALTAAFRRDTERRAYCALGSVKTNIGHLDAAAGVAGIIKAALSLYHEQIPASLNFSTPNPQIDFDASPFFVSTELRPWPRSDVPRRAAVSSFGLGGTNAHVILEEPPPVAPATASPTRSHHLLVLSGKTASAVDRLRHDLADHLEVGRAEVDLADVAFTLGTGRERLPHRLSLTVSGTDDAVERLREPDPLATVRRESAAAGSEIAFMFPGQGAQYPGMGAGLYRAEPVFAAALDECAAIVDPIIGRSLLEVMFAEGHDPANARLVLDDAAIAQPATVAIEYALARLWMSWGLQPSVMVGHSLGEFTAACLGGVFDLPEALRLVANRGRMMQELTGGGMLAIMLEPAAVAPLLDENSSIAAINGPEQCVVSGPSASISALEEQLVAGDIDARRLSIDLAAHSSMMDPMVGPFRELVASAAKGPLRIPMVSTATGRWITNGQVSEPQYWADHVRETVRFSEAAGRLLEHGDLILLEVGPGQTLSSLIRQQPDWTPDGAVITSLPRPGQDVDEDAFMLGSLGAAWSAGADIDWTAVHRGARRRVPLPTYPFEHQRHWIDPIGQRSGGGSAVEHDTPARAASGGDERSPSSGQTDDPVTVAVSRRDRIAARVVSILSDLSGIPGGQVDPAASFVDMGLDSLFLTQANSLFRKEFGVRITFRHLYEQAPSVDALAAFIDGALPADALPDPQAKRSDAPATSATSAGRPAASRPGPGTARRRGPISSRQEGAIADLVHRYNDRTAGSKRLAQRWRPRLADNRTIVGFDPLWKELVYQIVSDRSSGARIWDVDGNEYIDTALGYGTNLFGHAPAFITEALRAELDRGFALGVQDRLLGEVTQMICETTGHERLMFTTSGGEAVETAIRMARTVTGRDKVAYFTDDIHGRSDVVLGRGIETAGGSRTVPMVAGVPQAVVDEALVLEYGTEAALNAIRAAAADLALVLVEPVRTRNPDLQPTAFLRELRRLADDSGFALVFDEIVTGFRAHLGGVQALFDVRADMTTYGKVIGGGLPIGVVAGSARYVDVIDGGPWTFGDASFPEADITASGGTWIKHPLTLAASRAVLRELLDRGPSLQADLNERTAQAVAAINASYASDGLPIHIEHFSSFFRPTFTGEARFAGLFGYYLRDHGVHTNPPSPSFLSTAHHDAEIEAVVEAYRAAGRDMEQGGLLAPPADRSGHPAEPEAGGPPGGSPSRRTLPLTDAQRDIWLMTQLGDEAAAAYNLSTKMRLTGDLDSKALHQALRSLVQRHEALRITFDAAGEQQFVNDRSDVAMPLVDLSASPSAERDRRLAAELKAESSAAYDLSNGPLFRAKLIRTGEADHTLVLSAHHLVCDGWSFGVMAQDLGESYSAIRKGESVEQAPATPFSSYVAMQLEQGPEAEPYWLDLYQEPPVQLDLPTDRAKPPVRPFECLTERLVIAPDLLASLRETATARGVTLFTILLGAWELLLHRLSGQPDFVNGLFVAGQASMGARDLVGLCVNFLPLRARLTPDERLVDYLERLKRSTYDAYDHQDYSIGKLASALQIARDASRSTLVSTVITLEGKTHEYRFDGLKTSTSSNAREFGAFDLEAYLTESDDELKVDFQYARALFDATTIKRWLRHFETLLRQMPAAADTPVSQLRLLGDGERQALLTEWNQTQAPLPIEPTHRRFERQAAETPDGIAIRTSAGQITYAELDARADRVARQLQGMGVRADTLVGVHLHRSIDMVVALLAVHKAGGAYVPLDPQFPAERLDMIVDDAGLQVLLTQESLHGAIDLGDVATLLIDADSPAVQDATAGDLGPGGGLSDLAYVIYTSGSTGKPKGVEIEHLALANLLASMGGRPGLVAEDALLAVTTVSFDIAALELFLPLITGATLVLTSSDEAVDAGWLRERLGVGDITVMQATPATWRLLLDAGWAGSPDLKVLCGGEALGQDLAEALISRCGSLWNMYGPTETTIWSSVEEVTEGQPVSIGLPIANTEMHILDGSLEPQPLGIPGDLYIGGSGLARGYRHQAALTADRFVEQDFGDGSRRRLYRTGDLARRVAGGRIEYLGRSDFQVKIRGYRIELGEIETVLARHDHVKECVVVAREGAAGSKRLVAYIVPTPGGQASVSELRTFLLDVLPEYMVPSLFVMVEAFPLTANRKVDRNRLPDPDQERPDLGVEMVPPRTPTEIELAAIWAEILDLEQVGAADNFFELGGDSLLALRCIMRANRAGLKLAPISIFRHQTVAELAIAADDAAGSAGPDQGMVTGPTPLTPAQSRFLTERETSDPQHWNLAALVQAPQLGPEALRSAVEAVLRHHDALRLRLWKVGGRWHQETAGMPDALPFESCDLAGLSSRERTATIEETCTRLQEGFDLARGPLIRVAHFDCGPDAADRLFVVIHHFAIDGLTWPLFWEDFEQAYGMARDGLDVSLPPKTTSFKAWASQLEELARTTHVSDSTDTWLAMPWSEVARLPFDIDAGERANTNASAADVTVELSDEETRRLLEGRQRPEQLIIAALARCLAGWTSSPTTLVDVLNHGRDAALEGVNLSRTMGFTLSYNPLVLSHPTWQPTPETIAAVARHIAAAPEGYSFELLRFLSPDVDVRQRLDALPRAQVLFNYDPVGPSAGPTALWRPADESTGRSESPRGLRQYPLAVRALLEPNLHLTFVYSTALHHPATIEAKAAEVAATLRVLLERLPATVS